MAERGTQPPEPCGPSKAKAFSCAVFALIPTCATSVCCCAVQSSGMMADILPCGVSGYRLRYISIFAFDSAVQTHGVSSVFSGASRCCARAATRRTDA
jgi:hypothetical protein